MLIWFPWLAFKYRNVQATNPEVRTYVNGTIYSLVSRSHFKTQAHERGLPDMLTSVAELSEPVFQNQITHILAHLNHPPEDDGEPEWQSDHAGPEDLGIDTMDYVDEYDDIHEKPVPGVACSQAEGTLGACTWDTGLKDMLTHTRGRWPGQQTSYSQRSGLWCTGQLVGEALLQRYSAPHQGRHSDVRHSSVSEKRPGNVKTGGSSLHSSRNTDAPFTRPMTPVHTTSRRQSVTTSAVDSPLTMHTKAKKAARCVNKVASGTGNAEEYIEAFGPRRELPRTPKLQNPR